MMKKIGIVAAAMVMSVTTIMAAEHNHADMQMKAETKPSAATTPAAMSDMKMEEMKMTTGGAMGQDCMKMMKMKDKCCDKMGDKMSAEEKLKMRYVNGEITKEQYLEMKKVITDKK